jgi:hypothetical protein
VKVKDESIWQEHLAEMAADPDPMAGILPGFIVKWCDTAESVMEVYDKIPGLDATSPITPIEALRDCLRATEQSEGRLTISFIGMALLIIGTHWEPVGSIDEWFSSMTTIEQNLYADVAAYKFAQLNADSEPTQEISDE